MITDSKLMNELNKLNETEFNFILTGSRAWGNQRRYSDWDYYTNYDLDVELYLQKAGYHQIGSYSGNIGDGSDFNLQCVYRKNLGESQIDIQLIKNVELKELTQDILLIEFPEGVSREHWRVAYASILRMTKAIRVPLKHLKV
jgi:hypothetical protein